MLGEVLSLMFLLFFIGLSMSITVARVGEKLTGRIMKKALRIDVPKNEKKNLERLFTIIWILVGLYGAWKVRGDLLAMLFAFLAFRSGANVTRTLVYTLHDREIIGEYTKDSRILSLIGKAAGTSLFLEGIFVFAFALAYKALSVTSSPTATSKGTFIVWLWLLGLVFGALFGWFIARNNRGILLEDHVAIVWFFVGKTGKEKTERIIKI